MHRQRSKRYGAMAIKSPSRRNVIGRRIFLANLTTLGITLVVVFLLFSVLIPVYFRQSAKAELRTAGRNIVRMLDTLQTLKDGTAPDRQKRVQLLKALQDIRIAGKIVNARMALVDAEGNIRFTNINDLQPEELRNVLKELQSRRSAYVYVKVPFESADGISSGALYLFTKIDDVSGVNRGVFMILAGSLLLGGLIAFGFSLWQQHRIGKPLKQLMAAVAGYSTRTYAPVQLNSHDEIQTLADTFNRMAHTLKLSDEAQTQLLQNISHELKTPLMSVQGYAEGIRDGILEGDDAQKSLDIIINESQRLKRLVEELLLLSKLENQDSAYAFRECAASAIINQAVDAVGGYARDRDIALEFSCEKDFTAHMDPDRMVQCLINILGNGIRYAQSRIRIVLFDDGKAGSIRITDDGKGFEPGEAARVFDRFYKGSQGGAGIGLTIALTIAEKHGGALMAQNAAAGGAEFILTLPHNYS